MTFVALVREAPCSDFTPEEFREALRRVLPGSRPSEALSVSVMALLDDGSLASVASLGSVPQVSQGRLLWCDDDWSNFVRSGPDVPRIFMTQERLLVPVLLGPVLYGVIDWRGPQGQVILDADVHARAAEEFLPALAKRIHR